MKWLSAMVVTLMLVATGTVFAQPCSSIWVSLSETDPTLVETLCDLNPGDVVTFHMWGRVDCAWDGIGSMISPIWFNSNYANFVSADLDPVWTTYMAFGVNCPDPAICDFGSDYPEQVLWYASACIPMFGCTPPDLNTDIHIGSLTLEITALPGPTEHFDVLIDTMTYPPGNYPMFSNLGGTEEDVPAWYGPIIICNPATGVAEKTNLPKNFYLSEVGPNPFKTSTSIRYGLPKKSDVNISVYNVSGRLVKTLFSGTQDAGTYNLEWNGTDNLGRPVASGAYFLRMEAGSFSSLKRLMVLR